MIFYLRSDGTVTRDEQRRIRVVLLIVFAAADSINELAGIPMRLPCLPLFCFSLIRSRSTRLFSTVTQKQSDVCSSALVGRR